MSAEGYFRWLDETIKGVRPAVAEPLRKAGFEPQHTGGGCMAWQKTLDDGTTLWISAGGAYLDADPDEPEWYAGRYADDGDGTIDVLELTLAKALELAAELPSPIAPRARVAVAYGSEAEFRAALLRAKEKTCAR
jgi:hypothetical protein